jgi:membrane protein DedA with SNARE-associated domain
LIGIDELLALYDYFGYAGILLMSFIIAIFFFLPIPYFPIPLIASFNMKLDPHFISLAGTIGAVLGRLIIFYLAYSGHNIITKKTKGRISSLEKLVSKYGWIGAFIAAITPISGSLIYITLGLAKYKPWKFATAVFAGEFLYNEIIVFVGVFLGRPFFDRILLQFASKTTINLENILIGIFLTIISIGIMLYLLLKVDWNKIIGKWFPWTISTASSKTLRSDETDGKK